jgi:ankyrin repeat protein
MLNWRFAIYNKLDIGQRMRNLAKIFAALFCFTVFCSLVHAETTPSSKTLNADLFNAVEAGDYQKSEVLLKAGADPNKLTRYRDQTATHVAASRGDVSLLRLLKNSGASLDLSFPPRNDTPLFLAAINGHPQAVSFLLENGADIKKFMGHQHYTVLHLAAGEPRTDDNTAVLKILIKYGANVNAVADNGESVLDVAINSGNAKNVEFLLKSGADPEHIGVAGVTPITYAVLGENINILRMLLKRRVSLYKIHQVYGFAPLHFAAEKGNLEAVKLLLLAGADVSQKSAKGELAEELAQKKGHFEVAEYLKLAHAKKISNSPLHTDAIQRR